ncbi:MAG TPA: hypothetical protein VGB14_16280 [Acidimicrobiales bacterium]|jgi:hypothetical protein
MTGWLGDGSYAVTLQPRGGPRTTGAPGTVPVPFTTLTWGRTRSATASATVDVALDSPEAELVAETANAWEHEVSIRRADPAAAGRWPEQFVGPVRDVPVVDGDTLRLSVGDLSAWWGVRLIHDDHRPARRDLTDIFVAYVDDAMAPDPSPGVVVVARPSGIVATRSVLAADYALAADRLAELARDGVPWTMVGRRLHVGAVPFDPDPVGVLVDHTLADANPGQDGTTIATKWYVTPGDADPDTGFAFAGQAGGVDSRLGLVERVADEDGIIEKADADEAAAARLAASRRAQTAPTLKLRPNAGVRMEDLIPGRVVTLRVAATRPRLVGDYMITDLAVTWRGGHEEVTVDLEAMA